MLPGRPVCVERGVIERQSEADGLRMVDEPDQERSQLIDRRSPRFRRSDRRDHAWIDDVAVDEGHEAAQLVPADPRKDGPCSSCDRVLQQGSVGEIEDAGSRERLVPVTRLVGVPPSHEGNVLGTRERIGPIQLRQRGVTVADRQRKTHARDGSGLRFSGSGEIGVRIHIGKADPLSDAASSKQAAEHDAAVATEDHHEAMPVEAVCECLAQRPTVLRDLSFVSRPAGWPIEIAVRGRPDVAEVGSATSLHRAKGAKRSGRTIDVLWLT